MKQSTCDHRKNRSFTFLFLTEPQFSSDARSPSTCLPAGRWAPSPPLGYRRTPLTSEQILVADDQAGPWPKSGHWGFRGRLLGASWEGSLLEDLGRSWRISGGSILIWSGATANVLLQPKKAAHGRRTLWGRGGSRTSEPSGLLDLLPWDVTHPLPAWMV